MRKRFVAINTLQMKARDQNEQPGNLAVAWIWTIFCQPFCSHNFLHKKKTRAGYLKIELTTYLVVKLKGLNKRGM